MYSRTLWYFSPSAGLTEKIFHLSLFRNLHKHFRSLEPFLSSVFFLVQIFIKVKCDSESLKNSGTLLKWNQKPSWLRRLIWRQSCCPSVALFFQGFICSIFNTTVWMSFSFCHEQKYFWCMYSFTQRIRFSCFLKRWIHCWAEINWFLHILSSAWLFFVFFFVCFCCCCFICFFFGFFLQLSPQI